MSKRALVLGVLVILGFVVVLFLPPLPVMIIQVDQLPTPKPTTLPWGWIIAYLIAGAIISLAVLSVRSASRKKSSRPEGHPSSSSGEEEAKSETAPTLREPDAPYNTEENTEPEKTSDFFEEIFEGTGALDHQQRPHMQLPKAELEKLLEALQEHLEWSQELSRQERLEFLDELLRSPRGRTSAIVESKLRVSLAHPRLLSKRYTSSFLVQLYIPSMKNAALRAALAHSDEPPIIHDSESSLKMGQTVKIRLSCPAIEFSLPVTKQITEKLNNVHFLGCPTDASHPGLHYATLTISDPESELEYHSMNFPIRIVDYAFDHVSRPLLSNVSSGILATGSVVTFTLTLLGQIDSVFGYATGTTAGALASFIYLNFLAYFRRQNVKIP